MGTGSLITNGRCWLSSACLVSVDNKKKFFDQIRVELDERHLFVASSKRPV